MNGQPNLGGGEGGARPDKTMHPDRSAFRETELIAAVAAAFNVTIADLCRPSRGPRQVARARQCAIYLARVVLGMTLAQAGNVVGRDRTTAAHACRVVEKLRDNPRFDQSLTALEAVICRCAWGTRP